MTTVTVTIGRNVGDTPMAQSMWTMFMCDVDEEIRRKAGVLYVTCATGMGQWDGVYEDNATWVADVPEIMLAPLNREMAVLAARYAQDCIAVTCGTTQLVSGTTAQQAASN